MGVRTSVIEVNVSHVTETTTYPAFQYDYGLTLKILNAPSGGSYDMHFGIDGMQTALMARPVESDGALAVTVPATLLMQTKTIHCYLFATNNEPEYGYTVYHILIPIVPRPKPTTSEYTPEEHAYFDDLVRQLETEIAKVKALETTVSDLNTDVNNSADRVEQLEDDVKDLKQDIQDQLAKYSQITFQVNKTDGCLYVTIPD